MSREASTKLTPIRTPRSVVAAVGLAVSISVPFLVGRRAEAGVPVPPRYARYCGPGRAVVRLRGKSFTVAGGRCNRTLGRVSPRWLWFGLFNSGSRSDPSARGLSLVVEPGNRPGRQTIIDSIVRVDGLDLAPTGAAFLAKDLRSGTFTLFTRGPARTRVTGSWNCG